MSRRRAAVSSGLVLSLVLVGGLATALLGWQAKPDVAPETLHPAKPVAAYVFDGFGTHQDAWKATSAQKSLVESGLLKVVNRLLDFVVKESGQPGATLAQQMVRRLLERGVSFSVAMETISDRPAPQVTLVLHGAEEFGPQLTKLLLANQQDGLEVKQESVDGRRVTRLSTPALTGYEIGWWTEGQHLVISGGLQAIEETLELAQGKAANLSTNETLKKLRSSQEFVVASAGYLDLKTIFRMVSKLEIPPIPDSGKEAVPVADLLSLLGLDKVGLLRGRWGFRGEAIWSEAVLETTGPRTGLLSLFDQAQISLTDLPPLPKDCVSFSAMQLDTPKLTAAMIPLVNQIIGMFAPEETPNLNKLLDQAKQHLGFDLDEDLLSTLGESYVLFMDPSASALVPAGGLLVKVNDADKLESTFAKLQRLATDVAGDNFTIKTRELNGRTIHVIQFKGAGAMFVPAWTIDKGWLVIGSTPQTVEAQIKRVDGKLPRWEPPLDMAAAYNEMPKKFTSLSFSDPRPGVRSMLSFAPTGISFAELGIVEWRKQRAAAGQKVDEDAEFPISADDVPVAEEVAALLFPNIAMATVDDEGIKWYSRSSLPGLPIPGGGSNGGLESVGVVAVLVALLLPAVQQAREAARRTQSKNNLKQIGLAIHNYHDTFGHLPIGTIPNAGLKPEERLSWMVPLLPYLDQAPLFNQIDSKKGFADDASRNFVTTPLVVLLNPSQVNPPRKDGYGVTNYVGIAGLTKDAPTLPITDNRVGMFGYDRVTRISNVTDGLSNTMMVTNASKDFGPWAQGGTATLRSLTTKPYINGPDGIGSPHKGGLFVLMGDGSVRFISENIDPATFEGLSTIHGGEQLGDF